MIYAATGHRPDKIFPPHWQHKRDYWDTQLVAFAAGALQSYGATKVISGMALGWDTAIASAAVEILQIPLIAAVPFEGQERLWAGRDQIRYRFLLGEAERVVTVCPYQLTEAFQKRNEWMVDHAEAVLALWNGSGGGTANCIRYARAWCSPIENTWPKWEALLEQQTA